MVELAQTESAAPDLGGSGGGADQRRQSIAVVIPCHRDPGADGPLTGYTGRFGEKGRFWTTKTRLRPPGPQSAIPAMRGPHQQKGLTFPWTGLIPGESPNGFPGAATRRPFIMRARPAGSDRRNKIDMSRVQPN